LSMICYTTFSEQNYAIHVFLLFILLRSESPIYDRNIIIRGSNGSIFAQSVGFTVVNFKYISTSGKVPY